MATIDWGGILNPFLGDTSGGPVRDPALLFHDDVFRCFHTALERRHGASGLYVDLTESVDLHHWTRPWRVLASEQNFCSPGNIIRVGGRWLMCFNSYPLEAGGMRGTDAACLWLAESDDLLTWKYPRPMCAERAPRRLDPFLIPYEGRFWCLYNAGKGLGLMVSDDLYTWQQVNRDQPVYGPADTPDFAGVEKPWVVFDGQEFVLFYSAGRSQRGIGTARSRSLVRWRHTGYLDVPPLAWAPGGVSGPSVADCRATHGRWVMACHGEQPENAATVLGLAWSEDLIHWTWR